MSTHTDAVRIECSCATCKINAVKVGASFPLKADVNPLAAERLGTMSAQVRHGLVFAAHDPALRSLPANRRPSVAVL